MMKKKQMMRKIKNRMLMKVMRQKMRK
jgi:hypothetical protein